MFSYTEPRENVLDFPSWKLVRPGGDSVGHGIAYRIEEGQRNGKQVIVKLADISDREEAAALIGADIYVSRAELPACEAGHYYWADLEGLTVRNQQGELLGVVDHLIETGAHDVLVLAGPGDRMIPFVPGRTVRDVSVEDGCITVDWDAGYWDE